MGVILRDLREGDVGGVRGEQKGSVGSLGKIM